MQYSSVSKDDNLMILNLKDGTTREARISYAITNGVDTGEPGEKPLNSSTREQNTCIITPFCPYTSKTT